MEIQERIDALMRLISDAEHELCALRAEHPAETTSRAPGAALPCGRQQAIIDALPAHIALLDRDGTIVAVNVAWREFALLNRLMSPVFCLGQSYVAACHAGERADEAARGIRQVLAGELRELELEYACHAPDEQRWFRMTVTPLDGTRPGALVAHVDISARVLALQALREHEQRLDLALSAAQLGTWDADLVSHTSIRSARHDAIFGHPTPLPMWTQQTLFEHIIEADRADAMRGYERALETGRMSVQCRIAWPDGSIHWIDANGQLFRDDDGRPVRMVGVVRDITELKQHEQLLHEREQHQRELNERIDIERKRLLVAQAVGNVGSWEIHRATDRGIWSDQTHKIFETDPATFTPTQASFLALVHADDRAMVARAFADSFRDPGPRTIEHRVVCRGGVKFVEERWQVFPDESGEPAIAVGTCLDITARHIANERLLRQEELLRIAGRTARLGGWSVEVASGAVTWSDQVCAIHDLPAGTVPSLDEAVGFYVHADHARLRRAFERCTATGEPYDLELEMVTAEQRRRWVRTIGHAERDASGAVHKVHGSFQDITERKLADEALAKSSRALKLLSRCNESLIRIDVEAELLVEICRIAVEVGGFGAAWVGYAADADAEVVPQAFAAHDGAAGGEVAELRQGLDTVRAVLKSGEIAMCLDAPVWRSHDGRERVFSACVCLPLIDRVSSYGVLMLGLPETRAPLEAELVLLRELADNLAFGIGNIRAVDERRRMQLAVLRVAETISTGAPDAFFTELASGMTEALGADVACIARLLPGSARRLRTIALVIDGAPAANFDYSFDDMPCEALLRADEHVVPQHASAQFPEHALLASIKGQVYIGRRLGAPAAAASDDDGARGMVGVMFVLFREPVASPSFVASTLQIFATRVTAELARQEADQRIREQASLLDQAHDAIIVKDMDDRIVYWNKGAERTYGWTAEEVADRRSADLFKHDVARFEAAHAALLMNGEWQGELIKHAKDGRLTTTDTRWTLMRDAAGQPKSVLAILNDITEKKKLESQFLRAQRMESIGTLAGGIAHDLNNVLTPILMSVQFLSTQLPDPDDQELLATMESSCRRGADLIKQVLSFARGLEGQRVSVNTSHLMHELLHVIRDTFPKNLDVRFLPARNLWSVTGDPTQLHQVLLNLCVNARDAMPDGGRLTISMHNVVIDETYADMNPDATPGSFQVIEVADTGTGIPVEIRERIFEPFFTTKEIGKGTGLGLSTVIGIVRSHGGFVTLYSELGRGSKFKVYLPANDDAPTGDLVADERRFPRGEGELVLVVDDELAIRNTMKRMLERYGYRVLLASHGAEAVAIYARQPSEIDLVLTDMAMPIMDGMALIVALRSIDPAVRIVGSSGLASNSGLAQLPGGALQHFVPKPYTADTMLRTLYEALHTEPSPAS